MTAVIDSRTSAKAEGRARTVHTRNGGSGRIASLPSWAEQPERMCAPVRRPEFPCSVTPGRPAHKIPETDATEPASAAPARAHFTGLSGIQRAVFPRAIVGDGFHWRGARGLLI